MVMSVGQGFEWANQTMGQLEQAIRRWGNGNNGRFTRYTGAMIGLPGGRI